MEYFVFKEKWDYQLLDSGAGFRLEQWGQYRLIKPDPQAIWLPSLSKDTWQKADAEYKGKDWHKHGTLTESWTVAWQNLKLTARLSPFKHTGIFPEQAANWEWISEKLKVKNDPPAGEAGKLKVLNLFGYTGAASILLAKLGAFVTHVDASKPALSWAKENQKLNNLPENSIRWILDDASKFVKREIKRGQTYDAILMDPPAFGHSPQGKTWKFAEDFPKLLADCKSLMSKNFKFFLINAYATNTSNIALQNVFEDIIKPESNTKIGCGELCLKQQSSRLLSTGITLRY